MFSAAPQEPRRRLRSLWHFVIAACWFLVAERVAISAAHGLTTSQWNDLLYRAILLFLLLVGYAGMGFAFERQREPLKAMGLMQRETARAEFGTGVAVGWGMMVLCVLPMAVTGGLIVTFWHSAHQFGELILGFLVLLVASLAEEVAFRGYPFQRLIEAFGPTFATILLSALFAVIHIFNPGSSSASTLTTFLAGWLLSLAYLRTRALWLPWGLHFGWNASMGLLFGLPISGLRTFSPVVSSVARGPLWLTGDGYGPEGSAVAVVVILIGIMTLILVTREYAYRYAQPVIIPGGIPVDLDAAARRQHEAAMGAAEPALVQIMPSRSDPALDGSTRDAAIEPGVPSPGPNESPLP